MCIEAMWKIAVAIAGWTEEYNVMNPRFFSSLYQNPVVDWDSAQQIYRKTWGLSTVNVTELMIEDEIVLEINTNK